VPKYLIVNADDLGAGGGVNRGIVAAHSEGILTSASLMVEAPASAEAADLVSDHPRLGIGLHLVLDPADAAGCRETASRQLERFQTLMGRLPTHVDSHHNVHRSPALGSTVVELADEWGLPLREHSEVRHYSGFYGREAVSAENLIRILRTEIPEGLTELACHPGFYDPELRSSYSDERELELAALVDPAVSRAIAEEAIGLVNFSDVPALSHRTGV
jgi:predicted glycoside hydrolase/deacetylase ChbG (UPF0249 family)